MLLTNQLERTFSFKDNRQEVSLADPSQNFTPEAVLNFYAQTYPILTTATIKGPEIIDDAVHYEFVTTIGTKG